MRPFIRSLLLLPVLLSVPGSFALAQDRTSESAVRVVIDNDLFALSMGKPDDHDYTHGTRILLSTPGAPAFLRRLVADVPGCGTAAARRTGCAMSTLEIGQEIYTPRVEGVTPIPGERPYSGWLYMAPAVHHIAGGRARSLRLLFGTTGPPSLAEEAQDGMHELLGEQERQGWIYQLQSELGVGLAFDERIGLERSLGGPARGALSVGWGAVLGSVRTAAHVEVLARLGFRNDIPWSPELPQWSTGARWYGLAGVRQSLVLRDLFVDGNTFHDSPSAERIPWARELTLGVGVRSDAYAVEYRWVQRGREYEAQVDPHAWGSVAFIVHWD